jgi:peptidoglycan/LPS O-acetylase OafA/YrhL
VRPGVASPQIGAEGRQGHSAQVHPEAAYYVAIAVVVLFWPRPTSFWDVVSHLFFVHGLVPGYARTMSGIFWSLTPAVIFYLLLPLLILKLPGLRGRLTLFAVLYALAMPTRLIVWQQVVEGRISTATGTSGSSSSPRSRPRCSISSLRVSS